MPGLSVMFLYPHLWQEILTTKKILEVNKMLSGTENIIRMIYNEERRLGETTNRKKHRSQQAKTRKLFGKICAIIMSKQQRSQN